MTWCKNHDKFLKGNFQQGLKGLVVFYWSGEDVELSGGQVGSRPPCLSQGRSEMAYPHCSFFYHHCPGYRAKRWWMLKRWIRSASSSWLFVRGGNCASKQRQAGRGGKAGSRVERPDYPRLDNGGNNSQLSSLQIFISRELFYAHFSRIARFN